MLLAVDDAVGELDVLGDADAVADADAEAVGVAVGVGETLGDEDGDGEEVGVCEDDRKGVNINWWVLYREGSGSCGKGCGKPHPRSDLKSSMRLVRFALLRGSASVLGVPLAKASALRP